MSTKIDFDNFLYHLIYKNQNQFLSLQLILEKSKNFTFYQNHF